MTDAEPCCAVVDARGVVVNVVMASPNDEVPPWHAGCTFVAIEYTSVSVGFVYDPIAKTFTDPTPPAPLPPNTTGDQF